MRESESGKGISLSLFDVRKEGKLQSGIQPDSLLVRGAISKLGGTGDMFGDYLDVDCAIFTLVSGSN